MPVRARPKKQTFWKRDETHLFMISFTAFFTVFYTFVS